MWAAWRRPSTTTVPACVATCAPVTPRRCWIRRTRDPRPQWPGLGTESCEPHDPLRAVGAQLEPPPAAAEWSCGTCRRLPPALGPEPAAALGVPASSAPRLRTAGAPLARRGRPAPGLAHQQDLRGRLPWNYMQGAIAWGAGSKNQQIWVETLRARDGAGAGRRGAGRAPQPTAGGRALALTVATIRDTPSPPLKARQRLGPQPVRPGPPIALVMACPEYLVQK